MHDSRPVLVVFEAITAIEGSSLGDTSAELDSDDRIVVKDGLMLVQVGDVGKMFNLVAFGGDAIFHKSHASVCKSTKVDKPVNLQLAWPSGRALVKEEFAHGITDTMRDYG